MLHKFFVRNIVPAALLFCVFNTAATLTLISSAPSSNIDLSGTYGGSDYDTYQRRDIDVVDSQNLGWETGSNVQTSNNDKSCSDSEFSAKKQKINKKHGSWKNHSNGSGNTNTNNTNWKLKYETLLKSYTGLQVEYTKIKQINVSLEIKIKEYESNYTQINDLKIKIQKLEAIIEDLKAKLVNAERDVGKWKAKYEDILIKIEDYKSQIVKLNIIIIDLKNKAGNSADLQKNLEEAYKKIAELQRALDEANSKIRKFMSHHSHHHKKKGSVGGSNVVTDDNDSDDDHKSFFVGSSLQE